MSKGYVLLFSPLKADALSYTGVFKVGLFIAPHRLNHFSNGNELIAHGQSSKLTPHRADMPDGSIHAELRRHYVDMNIQLLAQKMPCPLFQTAMSEFMRFMIIAAAATGCPVPGNSFWWQEHLDAP